MKKKIALFLFLALSATDALATPATWDESPLNRGDLWTSDYAPVASEGRLNVPPDQQTSGFLTATDLDGNTLFFSVVRWPLKGTLVMADVTIGHYTYTPNPGASGSDAFVFKVADMVENSNNATISVTILDTDDVGPTTTPSVPEGTYTSPQSITLSCTAISGCAAIYYTLDGTLPTTSSLQYDQPLLLSQDTTVKFFAQDNNGDMESIETLEYKINNQALRVIFSDPIHDTIVNELKSIAGEAYASSGIQSVYVQISKGSGTKFLKFAEEDWFWTTNSNTWLPTVDLSDDRSLGFWGVNTRAAPWSQNEIYEVTARATNKNGQTSTQAVTFTYTDDPVVSGIVKDGRDNPIVGATITFNHLDGSSATHITNAVGYFAKELSGQWVGTVHVEKAGYEFSMEDGDLPYSLNMAGQIAPQLRFTATALANEKDARAIIVAGGDLQDNLWPATNANANFAYRTLIARGINKNHIYYFSHDTAQDADGDGLAGNDVEDTPSLVRLENTIQSFINDQEVDAEKPLYIYLVDHGENKKIYLTKPKHTQAETLHAAVLDGWLDTLQQQTESKVVLIYDACYSGSFLPELKATTGQSRILIASTGNRNKAIFSGEYGGRSFSSIFWNKVFSGASVRQGFLKARSTMMAMENSQVAAMDDNGDGLYDKLDGDLAKKTWLGDTVLYASVLPEIVETSGNVFIEPGGQTTLWVKTQQDPNDIDRVKAVILPPGIGEDDGRIAPVTDLPMLSLKYNSVEKRFEADFDGSSGPFMATGKYTVSFVAVANNEDHLTSIPVIVYVQQGQDAFEPDNSLENARVVAVDDSIPQWRTIHPFGDEDWATFYALADNRYEIKLENVEEKFDPVMELYDSNNIMIEPQMDENRAGKGELLDWVAPKDGVYYVRIRSYGGNEYGPETGYEFRVLRPDIKSVGFVTGAVLDSNQNKISTARLHTDGPGGALSSSKGLYSMAHPPGTYNLTATADGYQPFTSQVTVSELDVTTHHVTMIPDDFSPGFSRPGDVSPADAPDGQVDVNDAVEVLRMVLGIRTDQPKEADVSPLGSPDGQVDVNDAVVILQNILGIVAEITVDGHSVGQ